MTSTALVETAALHPAQDREAGLAQERQGDRRVTAYDPVLALTICERVAQGETLKAICVKEDEDGNPTGMPARATFYRWVVNQPDLARAYSAAKELSAYSLEEEALELGRQIVRSQKDSAQVRAFDVHMNQLRWSASRRNPRVYSDKGAVQITVPIQINTSLNLAQEGAPPASNEAPDDVYDLKAVVDLPRVEEEEPELDRDRMNRGGAPVVGDLRKQRGGRKAPVKVEKKPKERKLTVKQTVQRDRERRLARLAAKKEQKGE